MLLVGDGYGGGVDGTRMTGNLVKNCDFHHNYDPYSPSPGNNANGLSFGHSGVGTNNTITGSRFYWNSDNGVNTWDNEGFVLIENSWSFNNGYKPGINEGDRDDFVNTAGGNGTGFKLGKSVVDNSSTVLRRLTNNIAYHNSGTEGNAFVLNYGKFKVEMYNNTSYDNDNRGFNFNDWVGENNPPFNNGINLHLQHIAKNNISYNDGPASLFSNESILSNNTFINNGNNSSYTVTNDDFNLTNPDELMSPRQSDGSLPNINFLHLAPGSALIDAGTPIDGIPYNVAPDLGAFETGGVLGASTYHFTLNLKYGSNNNEVKELQKLLISKGYLKIKTPTTLFGSLTLKALKAYQKDNNLTPDGIVGPLTRGEMNK